MTDVRVALVPGVVALRPEYASIEDPIASLRSACRAAVATLGTAIGVAASGPSGQRVGEALLAEVGALRVSTSERPPGLLVIANGSATRTEKAPGHLDDRAAGFDLDLRDRLADPESLAGIDRELAGQLWADVESLVWLAAAVSWQAQPIEFTYADAPFGVDYLVGTWQGRWRCES